MNTALASDPRVETLWRAFALDPTGPARQELFETYFPFARGVAAGIRRERSGADLDLDDMRQHAAEGLLQAIDRFDPARGTPFEPFAAQRISGCVVDGIGASRELRRQASFRNRVRAERLRSLRPEEIGNLDAGQALQALAELAAEIALGFILDETSKNEGEIRDQAPNAYENLAWVETVKTVAAALNSLPDQERSILNLHYREGLEFSRIADTLRLSRGRVSQIHAMALHRLRKRLPNRAHLHLGTDP